MTVVFKDENVQRTVDGYPCTRGSNSRYPGYFVAGTTLKNSRDVPGAEIRPADAIAPSECSPLRNIDAETVPYFVIPGGALGQATIGDIVVVQVDSGLEMRTVYAVAADAGPITHFGEGSVALSQALAGKRQPVVNNHALNRLEIDDRIVTVLILGGTKSLLKNDYSQSNLEAVGEAELKHWAGEGIDANELLKACAAAATPN
jgi:hypothetical protein